MSDLSPLEAVFTDDIVRLSVPADAAYVSVLRTVTASLASRRDFTIEEIDDLRIAIDEACSLLLPFAAEDAPGRTLEGVFSGPPDCLTVRVTASPAQPDAALNRTSFAWLVLVAVAENVQTEHTADTLTISFDKVRGPQA